ncbi:MAG: hypothetical protein ACREOU_10230 [Candidatus Eiseniibacteriota bacterium]
MGRIVVLMGVAALLGVASPHRLLAQASDAGTPSGSAPGSLPPYLRDRDDAVPTSMFGTYILPGELMVYPFFEYYRDSDAEYSPVELGHSLDQDFRGDYEAHEYLLLLAYGLSDRVSVEVEAAYITAELEKAPEDPTGLPPELTESGLGDVQVQGNWLWQKETASRPAFFSQAEVVFPFQDEGSLIGTSAWEVIAGVGAIRGYAVGTFTARASIEFDGAESSFGLGEAALEYLKRFSPAFRGYAAVEGTQDEWELITELQVHPSQRLFVKLNSAFGISSKAAGWAPEVGVVFRF